MDRSRRRLPTFLTSRERPEATPATYQYQGVANPAQPQQPWSVPMPPSTSADLYPGRWSAPAPVIPPYYSTNWAPQSPEQPFVAVNPFDAPKRRWEKKSRPTRPVGAPETAAAQQAAFAAGFQDATGQHAGASWYAPPAPQPILPPAVYPSGFGSPAVQPGPSPDSGPYRRPDWANWDPEPIQTPTLPTVIEVPRPASNISSRRHDWSAHETCSRRSRSRARRSRSRSRSFVIRAEQEVGEAPATVVLGHADRLEPVEYTPVIVPPTSAASRLAAAHIPRPPSPRFSRSRRSRSPPGRGSWYRSEIGQSRSRSRSPVVLRPYQPFDIGPVGSAFAIDSRLPRSQIFPRPLASDGGQYSRSRSRTPPRGGRSRSRSRSESRGRSPRRRPRDTTPSSEREERSRRQRRPSPWSRGSSPIVVSAKRRPHVFSSPSARTHRSRSRSPSRYDHSRTHGVPILPPGSHRRSSSLSHFVPPLRHSLRMDDPVPSSPLRPVIPPSIPPFTRFGSRVDIANPQYKESGLSLPLPATAGANVESSFRDTVQDLIFFVLLFLFDAVPRKIYLHLLLRIPSLYFTRVTRIFEDAQLSLPDIKKMARARAEQWNSAEQENPRWPTTFIQQFPSMPDPLPRSLLIFRSNWENFIDDLMSEWQTLNIVSVLLLSAILTVLQIDAASQPVTRTSALFSLICALMSLLYGCIYIIRFGSMRKMYKASSFADEAQKTTTSIWWSVWVLLAMPAVWLAWAMISFFVCIMSFIWLTGSSQDSTDFVLSPRAALGVRIALTSIFSLGLIYFVLIVQTFHRWGDVLDREWTRRVTEWAREAWTAPQHRPAPAQPPYSHAAPPTPPQPTYVLPTTNWGQNVPRSVPSDAPCPEGVSPPVFTQGDGFFKVPDFNPVTTPPPAFSKLSGPVLQHPSGSEPYKFMRLGSDKVEARVWGPWAQTMEADDLNRFVLDISNAWKGRLALEHGDAVTGDHDADLPVYTLLPPPRPDTPSPDRARNGFAANAFVSRNETASDSSSSYGQPVAPSNAAAASAGSNAPASESSIPERVPTPSPVIETRSLSRPSSWSSWRSAPIVNPRAPSRSPSRSLERPSNPPPIPSPVNGIAPRPAQAVRELIALWNERYFRPRNVEALLVPLDDPTSDLSYGISLEVLRSPPGKQSSSAEVEVVPDAAPAGIPSSVGPPAASEASGPNDDASYRRM